MISFQKAVITDIPQLWQLAKKSWNAAYTEILAQEQIDYMLHLMYSAEELSDQLQNPVYHYYLVFIDETVAGFFGYENHYEANTTKLHRIYLLQEHKGKGLGKKSLEFIKGKVAEAGDQRIILNVNKNNPAKKMYESQGFKVYDTGVFDIGNGFVMDDYLMELAL